MRFDEGDGMSKTTVDISEFLAFVKKAALTGSDLLKIEKPGELTILNTQRTLVKVVTGNLQGSINIQTQSSSALEVVSHIGPNTPYAAAIEFGRPDIPNFPIQPYVRPSGMVGGAKKVIKTMEVAFTILFRRKVG